MITGGTSPYGDPPGGTRMRPLVFIRELLCLRASLQRAGCPVEPKLDALAHHPITTSGGPHHHALHPDDVAMADLGDLRRTLRAAKQRGTIGTAGTVQLWVTEFWWESNPPDTFVGVPERQHARWIEEALFLMWKQDVAVAINLLLRDDEYDRAHALATLQSGVFFHGGRAKAAFTATRFPFVAETAGKSTARAWGRSPAPGRLAIERHREGGWSTVQRIRVKAGEFFTTPVRAVRGQRLRARVGGESSLSWRIR